MSMSPCRTEHDDDIRRASHQGRQAARHRDYQPDVTQRFQLDGAEAVGSSPQEFAAFLKAEMQKWSKVISDAGIKPEQ